MISITYDHNAVYDGIDKGRVDYWELLKVVIIDNNFGEQIFKHVFKGRVVANKDIDICHSNVL